jgi:3-hydroxyacyl-[acyl-carrier-protein] dehydratase
VSQLALADIQQLIPHRDPFLFISHAQVASEKEILGVASWPGENPIFKGLFLGKPVVPGLIQVEACAQLAGVLLGWNSRKNTQSQEKYGVLGAIRQAHFQNVLPPESAFQMECQIRAISSSVYLAQARGHSGQQLILTCEFVIVLGSGPTKKADKR